MQKEISQLWFLCFILMSEFTAEISISTVLCICFFSAKTKFYLSLSLPSFEFTHTFCTCIPWKRSTYTLGNLIECARGRFMIDLGQNCSHCNNTALIYVFRMQEIFWSDEQ